jgi:hypothetical protein
MDTAAGVSADGTDSAGVVVTSIPPEQAQTYSEQPVGKKEIVEDSIVSTNETLVPVNDVSQT